MKQVKTVKFIKSDIAFLKANKRGIEQNTTLTYEVVKLERNMLAAILKDYCVEVKKSRNPGRSVYKELIAYHEEHERLLHYMTSLVNMVTTSGKQRIYNLEHHNV